VIVSDGNCSQNLARARRRLNEVESRLRPRKDRCLRRIAQRNKQLSTPRLVNGLIRFERFLKGKEISSVLLFN
jgi:hypothetical protein